MPKGKIMIRQKEICVQGIPADRKIACIKAIRSLSGLSLVEAKNIADNNGGTFAVTNPDSVAVGQELLALRNYCESLEVLNYPKTEAHTKCQSSLIEAAKAALDAQEFHVPLSIVEILADSK